MNPPVVIIVSGPPASGKTTLALRLAVDLGLPCFCKDHIKEALFETLGWADRDWCRKLGAAATELLYVSADAELRAGRSFVIESNFHTEFAIPRFLALREKYLFVPVQIQCRTDGPTLLARYEARAVSGSRHPFHFDRENVADLAPSLLNGRYDDLEIGGIVLHVDTTDFARLDYRGILLAVSDTLCLRTEVIEETRF